MLTWTETIKVMDNKKLCNVTNEIIRQIKVIRQSFMDAKSDESA